MSWELYGIENKILQCERAIEDIEEAQKNHSQEMDKVTSFKSTASSTLKKYTSGKGSMPDLFKSKTEEFLKKFDKVEAEMTTRQSNLKSKLATAKSELSKLEKKKQLKLKEISDRANNQEERY